MSDTRAVENAILKCVEKATEVIRRKRWNDYYWIVSSVRFEKGRCYIDTYFPSMPRSFNNAKNYVRNGGNVFAFSQSSAIKLAYAIVNVATPVGPEIHGTIGYYWRYNAHGHVGGHIFFVFWG